MRPGGEFVENIAEIREGLDIVEFAGFDQGINGGSTSAALVIAGEEKILPTYSHPAECSFDNVMPTPGLCRVLGANKKISGESRLLVIGLSALSKALKEREQGVRGFISSGHKAAHLGMRQRTFLQLHVGMQVDLGCLRRFVTEPKSDHAQIHSPPQQAHGRRVPQGMWRHGFPFQGRTGLGCGFCVT